MTSKSSIFKPYDPLVEVPPLFAVVPEIQGGLAYTLRPVWIIGDLKTLYRWLNSTAKQSNWNLDTEKETLFQRYKNLLLSDRSQAFMIMENDLPLAQFDILDSTAPQPEKISVSLNFLFEENFRDPNRFTRSLRLLLQYLFSFPQMLEVGLRLPKPDKLLLSALGTLGFRSYDPDSQTTNYRLTRMPDAHPAR